MIPHVYAVRDEDTSPRWAQAFAAGCGGAVVTEDLLQPGPVALFGSPQRWRLLSQARAERREFYYGDHAYFGRGVYFRATRTALQHSGTGHGDRHRLSKIRKWVRIRPWQTGGRHILLAPNSPTFFKLHGTTAEAWEADVRAQLAKVTDRPIRVRWKNGPEGQASLAQDLRGCWAVVVFTSNVAVDAIMAGVPAFCTGPCVGLARGNADLSKIETPSRPGGRTEFAAILAANQWTLEEYQRGAAWAHLQEAPHA